MATPSMVWNTISQQVALALVPLLSAPSPPVVNVVIDWPAENVLMDVAQGNQSVVSIFDKNTSKDVTRYLIYRAGDNTLNAPGTHAAIDTDIFPPSSPVNITLTGTPAKGDNIGIGVWTASKKFVQVYTAVALDTLTTIASNLAVQINADPVMGLLVSAASIGPVLSLINISTHILYANAKTGSFGIRHHEVRRVKRDLQVTIWTFTEALREALGDPIDSFLSRLQSQYGVLMTSGSGGDNTSLRIEIADDQASKDYANNDLFRRDFHLECEYGVTTSDLMYALIQPVPVLTST